MKIYLHFAFFCLLLFSSSCKEDESTSLPVNTCFKKDAIQELPWLKAVVSDFQKPKSGDLKVLLYVYKNEYFIGLNNPLVSAPASYIYNCSGENIGKLNITYNQFMSEARAIDVLLQGSY